MGVWRVWVGGYFEEICEGFKVWVVGGEKKGKDEVIQTKRGRGKDEVIQTKRGRERRGEISTCKFLRRLLEL